MKRLVVLFAGAAFCLSLFSPIANGSPWDPKHPPVYPERPTLLVQPSGDDGSWNDPTTSPLGAVIWLTIDVILMHLHFDASTIPAENKGDTMGDLTDGLGSNNG